MIKNFFNRILQYYYSTNKKEVLLQNAGKDMEQLELSCVADGNAE